MEIAHAHASANSAIAQSGKRTKICANFKQILDVIMPRKYVKKGTTGQWSQQQLESALKRVDDGMTVSAAAKRFGIPKQTLHNHYSGKLMIKHHLRIKICSRQY